MNDQPRALALGDLLDLGAGELAVEQDQSGTDLGGAVEPDQEPPVVADQQRDTVAAADAQSQQSVGDGVGRGVEFTERQLAVVVDDCRAVGVPPGVERRDHAELTPAPDVGDHGRHVLRRLQLEGARLEHLPGVVQLG